MLTKRQSEVLAAVMRFIQARGYSPVYAELGRELRIGQPTVHKHLHALARKGYVALGKHPRGIAVIPQASCNGQAWIYCDRDHPPILHQAPTCPCCEFVDAAAGLGLVLVRE